MATGQEGSAGWPTPLTSPELAAYLGAPEVTDPASILVASHIPALIGGIKSTQFIIQEQGATPDTPPDPDNRVALGELVVPAQELKAFSSFFEQVEAQADAQYDAALFETQQALADAQQSTNADIKTLFVPDSVNPSASDYFKRLKRLAQDTGLDIVMRVADRDDGELYQRFKRFEPIRAATVADYWESVAVSTSPSSIHIGNYAIYAIEGAYPTEYRPLTAESLAAIARPVVGNPLVFTTFEDLQKSYPNSPISDPKVWESIKHEYTLVSTDAEATRMRYERDRERNNLTDNIRNAARANTEELRALLLDNQSPFHDKLPVIREMASATEEPSNILAGMVLAKIGDKEFAQTILQEIQDETKGYGSEGRTIVPLGIYMRSDSELFDSVVGQVKDIIDEDPGSSHRLISLLGALYHTHDPRVGEMLADYLTVPTRNKKAYAFTVLHAAIRWMPEYVEGLRYQTPSLQGDRSLKAIETKVFAFLDDYNHGKLDDILKNMVFHPDRLLPLLLSFSNPTHRELASQIVLRQFQEGGSILSNRNFQSTYLMYRATYGDLPEISKHIRPL